MLQLEKRETIADVINLVLGAWLFLTPWIFGFVPNTAASWNAWLSGVAIGVVALAALLAFAEWEEWINLLLGVWVQCLHGLSGLPSTRLRPGSTWSPASLSRLLPV
jgi:SPW repeat-containing protein